MCQLKGIGGNVATPVGDHIFQEVNFRENGKPLPSLAALAEQHVGGPQLLRGNSGGDLVQHVVLGTKPDCLNAGVPQTRQETIWARL